MGLAITVVVELFLWFSDMFYTSDVIIMAAGRVEVEVKHNRFPMFTVWFNELSVEVKGD